MIKRIVPLLSLMLVAMSASADEMIMQNGSRILGKLVSAGEGLIVFDTPFAGEIKVKSTNVVMIRTDEQAVVMMSDGEVFRDKQIIATNDVLLMQREGEAPRNYEIEQIKLVNPAPWLLGEGYNFTGRTGLAFEAERGNSETDEWDLDYRIELRSLKDRFVSRGRLEYDEASNQEVTDNWELRNKYDRFTGDDPDNYWGGKLRLEYDQFADLDLRILAGPHIGRQFVETGWLDLKGEIGIVYVDEQFDVAEDNDYYGSLIEFEAESNALGFGTTLYMYHDTTLNFDSADEPLSNTRLGLRMPLIFGFETAFEARFEYNGGAPDDVDTTDETYNFKIGYAW